MAFKRDATLCPRPTDVELTRAMAGIGMNFASESDSHADIEGTLVHASSLGMDDHDLRVLSVLTTWIGVHQTHVNVD